MTKSQKSALLNYLIAACNEKYYICQCIKDNDMQNEEKCAAKISAIFRADKSNLSKTAKTSNLKRHFRRFHSHVGQFIAVKDCDESKTCSGGQQATP